MRSAKLPVISRRKLLHNALAVGGTAAAVLSECVVATAAQAQDTGQVTQAAAAYQTSPKNGQKCLDCAYFTPPAACTMVSGTISRVGWCKFYAKKD